MPLSNCHKLNPKDILHINSQSHKDHHCIHIYHLRFFYFLCKKIDNFESMSCKWYQMGILNNFLELERNLVDINILSLQLLCFIHKATCKIELMSCKNILMNIFHNFYQSCKDHLCINKYLLLYCKPIQLSKILCIFCLWNHKKILVRILNIFHPQCKILFYTHIGHSAMFSFHYILHRKALLMNYKHCLKDIVHIQILFLQILAYRYIDYC